jgi:HD-GYP domain-containing protein (c-di-GMP phosphodiesterase class II)
MNESYFSVSLQMVTVNQPMGYDLYINSSSIEGRERFVRIFRKGETLTHEDLTRFKDKYHSIYVAETERSAFLRSMVASKGATIAEKTTVLKDSAIAHLKKLFDGGTSPEQLGLAVTQCRDVVDGMIDVLEGYDIDTLRDLIGSLSFHDFYTYDHSINVCMYCILLYRVLEPEAPRSMIIQAGMGGLLHDLGKIKIPTTILNKTDKLDEAEFAEIKKHPAYGQELLAQCASRLPDAIDSKLISRVIHEHHENFNGTGYPTGLSGEHIHLLSRITAIADFFDAITTKRSYHEPLSPPDALAVMAQAEGKKLDPELFQIFSESTRAGEIHRILRRALPEDFDPCQPHRTLPWIDAKQQSNIENKQGFGQIKMVVTKREPKEPNAKTQYPSNVKVISTQELAEKGTKPAAVRKKA